VCWGALAEQGKSIVEELLSDEAVGGEIATRGVRVDEALLG